jgi:hypothetical protein
MTSTADRYADWKAPKGDGQMLVWPPPAQLLRDTVDNSAALATAEGCRVQNVPVPALRQQMRRWLGHPDGQPLVATGHQTELYHPGVWVKDCLTHAAADKLGGSAVHFAIDTDQPKHLAVRWPGTTIPITDDPAVNTAEWSGQLSPPTPVHVEEIARSLATAAAGWPFRPMLDPILASLRRQSIDDVSLSAALTNAQHELDWDLGLRHRVLLASPLMTSAPYLAFVHHVLALADRFAADYNAALADYRVEAGITSNTRPMPDLRASPTTAEVPFWFDDLAAGTRGRAQVVRSDGGWSLASGDDRFPLDPAADGLAAAERLGAWLSARNLRLAPRALTLTTFLRLLVVDQFVHGIGGGRYDQVTDRLLSSHFGIAPPRFAVTTATLIFPGAVGQTRVCVPCVQQDGHRLRHGLLGEAKREAVAAIDALPRRSVQRSLAFHNLHAALSAAALDHPALKAWAQRYEATQRAEREEQVLFDRELFYAVQTRERLGGMVERYRAEFA